MKLDPGGYHIMFMGMKQQLKEGEHFKATLDFEKAGKVDVDFTVAGIGATHGGGSFGTMTPKMQMEMKPKQQRRQRWSPADRLRQPGRKTRIGEYQHQRHDLHATKGTMPR